MCFYEFKTNRVYKHIFEFTKHLIHNQQKSKGIRKCFYEKNIKEITLQLRLTLFDWITLHGFADRVTILCGFAARK